MEIMRLTFQMDLLVSQAPNGVLHNMNPTQFIEYTNKGISKQGLVAELFALMMNDHDL
jgi:hypothetical protein